MYGCLFLVVGAGLLAITYALVRHATDSVYVYNAPDGTTGAVIRNQNGSGSRPAITGSSSRREFRRLRRWITRTSRCPFLCFRLRIELWR